VTQAARAIGVEGETPRARCTAAAATGLVLLAQLGVWHVVLRASASQAYFLGHPIALACGVRARLGVPCPGCGVTRALGLTLHGQIEDALRLFPAAPLAVFGIASFALVLLAYSAIERWGSAGRGAQLARATRAIGVVYACSLIVVWLGDWTLRLAGLRV
jgi:hypothetical protein